MKLCSHFLITDRLL